MCGFVGYASTTVVDLAEFLYGGSDILRHRGPDQGGTWTSEDKRLGVSHRRLSIIDLSSAAGQPMRRSESGLTIAFNGEIYNHADLRRQLEALGHRFTTKSDTEVLLVAYVAWGVDLLSRLNGMFSFALFDEPQGRVLLARDRVGEKPLYYRYNGTILYFASELKALLRHRAFPRRVDVAALDCYLAMGFVPGDRCILSGFNKLAPAHALTFNTRSGESRAWRYWAPPATDGMAARYDDNQLLDELEVVLENAVGRQLIADVPIGVLLSGGVDSSLVTAMAVRRAKHVRTFSVGFPGYDTYDESQHARRISAHFQTDHAELMVSTTSAELIPLLATQFDEPLIDSSMMPTWLVANMVSKHCKVVLGGDGGDELFGGYPHYRRLLWFDRRVRKIPRGIRRCISWLTQRLLPVGFKGSNYLGCLDYDLTTEVPFITRYFTRRTRKKLMGTYVDYGLVAEGIRNERTPKDTDLLQRMTRMDFLDYLAEDILVKVDRASMHNSLEVRAPFLDQRMVEFAFKSVPSRLKATEFENKILLKRLATRVLPSDFDIRRKQGFSIPIEAWLKAGHYRELFWDTLLSSDCVFDRVTVQSLLRCQDLGFANGERLFALVQFELWRKGYGVTV
jgi:asparagine synthase (glutamine-hydrolysing)